MKHKCIILLKYKMLIKNNSNYIIVFIFSVIIKDKLVDLK